MPIYIAETGGAAGVAGLGIYSTIIGNLSLPARFELGPYSNTSGPFPTTRARLPFPKAGTLKDFTVKITIPALTGPVSFTVYVDGAPTALTVVVPPTATGLFTSPAELAVTAGQKISFVMDGLGATSSIDGSLAVRLA